MRRITFFSILIFLFAMVTLANAKAAGYSPFILGTSSDQTLENTLKATQKSLAEQGFEVVGQYEPNADTHLLIVTHSQLKKLAGLSKNGGFGAMERIALVNRNGKIEISYTNPTYMWNVYRMEGDITPIQMAMEKALGRTSEFGADEPLSAEELREYHYKMLMPYFDDVDELAEYSDYDQAVAHIEKALAEGKGGAKKVYRIDMPDVKQTVFGVALSRGEGSDENILSQIDGKTPSHAAHLPYEILVNNDEALALNGKFRIAINWPSLSMMGSGSFMSIANAPDEILEALEKVAEKE